MKATKWCGRSWLAHVRIVKSDWLNVWKSGGARRFELSCAVDFKREGCATHVNANGLWFQIACTCKEGLRGRIKGPREYSSVVSVMGKRRSKNPQHPERVTLSISSLHPIRIWDIKIVFMTSCIEYILPVVFSPNVDSGTIARWWWGESNPSSS